MRIPRSLYLPQAGGGLVHKFWRAHNKDFLLKHDAMKSMYLSVLRDSMSHKSVNSEVSIHAFCTMSNHSHVLLRYKDSSLSLSNLMRVAHSNFGQRFNRLHERQGPVAYDRPKTPLVQQSAWNEMRVHFYIEANPLRARMTKNLKLYRFSSFSFYAWGKKTEHTAMLSAPQWYLDLAKTAVERRSRYRSLFNKYLQEILRRNPALTAARFVGDNFWNLVQTEVFSKALAEHRSRDPAPAA